MKLTGIAILTTALTCSAFSAEPFIEKLDLFKAGDGGYKLHHIPGIVVTAKGTVLAWCEARKNGSDWDDIRILLRRSTDDGKTWSAPKSIADVPGPKTKNPVALAVKGVRADTVTYNNPVLIADRDGPVHMVFCLEYMRCFYQRSDDDGQLSFHGDVDFSRPNEAYHDHVAKMIGLAESLQLLVVMSQPWLGCCEEGFGNRPDKPIQRNGPAKNRQYGQYLGRKFAAAPNLFWIMGGDNDPKGDRECLFAFFEGLRETAPAHQLMTYHASPPHSSTDLFQYAPWLGFSFVYAYWPEKPNDWVADKPQPHVYEAALREYQKSDIMPFVLGESQYEGMGVKDNDMGTPQMVRRQAYWTMLCGGAGHAYGSDLWYFPPNWRDIMKYPGAVHLGHFIQFFERIPWWTLQPDIRHQAVVAGYGDWSKNNYVTAAVSPDRKLMVAYLPELQSVTVDFGYLQGSSFAVSFFDPRTGERIKTETVTDKKVRRIPSPPGDDLVLMVRTQESPQSKSGTG